MKVLLTGKNGQLGKCFLDRAPTQWEVYAPDHATLDISSKNTIYPPSTPNQGA